MKRRIFSGSAVLAMIMIMVPLISSAETFPSKSIRIIVPYAAGGLTDMLARLVGKHITEKTGQIVIVDNRPGANGMLGSSMVAKATPDGYTIGVATPGNHAANASLYKDVPYDTIKDFVAISQAVDSPMVLTAHPSLGVKTVGDLVAKAKAAPGTIIYASGGTGSSMHLAMESFAHAAGIQMVHVPYKGSGAAYIDLLTGRTQLILDIIPQVLPRVRKGELIALGVASAKRVPELPEVPTIDEAGVKGFSAASWYGFVGPSGIPPKTLDRLNQLIVDALRDSAITRQLQDAGMQVVASSPSQFQSFIEAQVKKAAEIIRIANIQPE